ncbi:MAG: hypothetical protein KKB70_01800 [Proteobacteria bacterium]|nr:hypothetical protein [Pseudomonadota bacterium]MBU1610594.1 hypothetical protein [Pseudomonadota bacterium]
MFACKMAKNHKMLSVCASSGFHGVDGYVQYRYGTLGKIEMQYPQEQVFTQDTFRMSRYTRSLVALVDLRFKVKDVGYSVYDDYNAESGQDEYDSGIRVTLPDGREVDIKCGPEVERNLYTIEEFIPTVEDE